MAFARHHTLHPAVAGAVAAAVATAMATGVVLAGYGVGGKATGDYWRSHQAAADQPELWAVEAVPQPSGWRPVEICADAAIRAGFVQPAPVGGGQPCTPIEQPVRDGNRYSFRCSLQGQLQGVSTKVTGDTRSGFLEEIAVTRLDGPVAWPGRQTATYTQTRRYRRIGSCPAGWNIGDHTDRYGARQHEPLVAQMAGARG